MVNTTDRRVRSSRGHRLSRIAWRVGFSLVLTLSLGLLPAPRGGPSLRPARAAMILPVTSALDEHDSDLNNPACQTASGGCTLRAAIEQLNFSGGGTILFPSEPATPITYTLNAALGTLVLEADTEIQTPLGAGPRLIDGDGLATGAVLAVAADITATLSGVTIKNGGLGGLSIQTGARVRLTDAAVTGNANTGVLNSGTLAITNTTVSGNTGSGLFNFAGATLTVAHSTVVSNTSSTSAGGVHNEAGGVATLMNTVVALNVASGRPDCFGALTSGGYNLIGNNQGCTVTAGTGDLVGTSGAPRDPRLGLLQFNGGPTPTHALLADSPALNAGVLSGCPATDQRGVTRPRGGRCDIGAFEVPAVRFQASGFAASESAGTGVITATLDATVPFTLLANFSTADGTALAGSEYAPVANGVITFPPSTLAATATVPITANALYTGDKWLSVAITAPPGISLAAPENANLTVMDAQAPPLAKVQPGSVAVLKSSGQVVITTTLNTVSGITATVPYTTLGGSAVPGRDYAAATSAVVFPPGQTTRPLTITLLSDGLYYGDVTFNVVLTAPVSATLGSPALAAITILDDNPRRVYLPITQREYDPVREVEPNDTLATATGPIDSGVTYKGSNKGAADPDIFFFGSNGLGTIRVRVGNLAYDPAKPALNPQVQLRGGSRILTDDDGNCFAGGPPFEIECEGVSAGLYNVLVYTPAGYPGGTYTLTVTYP